MSFQYESLFFDILVWSCIVSMVLAVIIVIGIVLLKRRGIYVYRGKFGLVLVFDSANEDGQPMRLLNVNGVFQSVCYLDPELRELPACVYHRVMGKAIVRLCQWYGAARNVHGSTEALSSSNSLDATRTKTTRSDSAHLATTHTESASSDTAHLHATSMHYTNPLVQVCVIGGAGYSLPKWLWAEVPEAAITVVEIDPKMTELARKHFFLDEVLDTSKAYQEERAQLICADGWHYLRDARQRFDVIVNDAFAGKKPMGPLNVHKAVDLIHSSLTQKGIYLANVRGAIEDSTIQELLGCLHRSFSTVLVIPEQPGGGKGYHTILATNNATPFDLHDLEQAR